VATKGLIFRGLNATQEWIWSRDPALAWKVREDFPSGDEGNAAFEAANKERERIWERYADTGDESELPIRDGWEPVRWVVGKLTMAQLQYLSDLGNEYRERLLTIAFCLRAVRGMRDEDGNEVALPREPVIVAGANIGERLTDDTVAVLFNDPRLALELFVRIRGGGLLTAAQRKSHPAPVVVP
jgi:hypothetical protein